MIIEHPKKRKIYVSLRLARKRDKKNKNKIKTEGNIRYAI
jgi:hypothetical protein